MPCNACKDEFPINIIRLMHDYYCSNCFADIISDMENCYPAEVVESIDVIKRWYTRTPEKQND